MSQIIPINIPTYISDQNYNPSRVLPRLFYYNGLIDCETYYFESGSLTTSGVVKTQTAFPYFDNYNVVSGSFPTAGSKSLLFNNEAVAYGSLPSSSLFTEYWDSYVSLLYNPKTRLLTAKAIIPLADYIKMELNDIVNFRGNYYHLRAINNYSLKTGDCELQLLGPIIPDALSGPPPPPPTPPTTASISWTNITDSDVTSSFRIYDNGSLKVSSSVTQGSSLFVSQSHIVNAELDVTPFPVGGVMTMSLNINGGATVAVSSSINTTLTASFVVTGGVDYYITASVNYTVSQYTIEYLMVGGGGGGGLGYGGGGGAGGLKSGSFTTPNALTYTAIVGLGGITGSNGETSSISGSAINEFVLGGGFGGYGTGSFATGSVGGSGGGGTGADGGISVSGSEGTSGQGTNGGTGKLFGGSAANGGGGGGAAKSGSSFINQGPFYGAGSGGSGSAWLDGNYYAGGGGGGYSGTGDRAGLGGIGGGGRGASELVAAAAAGSNNTGGGGGGSATTSGTGIYVAKAGGSGIVKLRYTASYGQIINGGQVVNSGSYYYHTFTSSANFTT